MYEGFNGERRSTIQTLGRPYKSWVCEDFYSHMISGSMIYLVGAVKEIKVE